MTSKAPSPCPPRLWVAWRDGEILQPTAFFDNPSQFHRLGFDHVERMVSESEHTHLLAEAVREAKAQVYQGFCNQLVKLINNHEEFERRGSPTWMALHEHLAIFRQKASELRKGATPKNGGKNA